MLLRIVAIMFPLFAIAAIGYFYGRRHKPDLSVANQLNLDVFVPALVFAALADKSFDLATHWGLALGAFVLVFGSGAAGWLIARASGVQTKTLLPPLMFNNCGNLGLPLAVLAFGEAALGPAVVMFMVSNLLHFTVGVWMLDHQARLAQFFRMPMTIATAAGLAVSLLGIEIWPPAKLAIKMLGDISIPLLLFSLGVRITDAKFGAWRIGVLGAAARPIVGMLMAWPLGLALGLDAQQQAMLLVFGALPPAVLNYVFAERYRQEPEQVASIVLIGNLAALLFLPIALAIVLRA